MPNNWILLFVFMFFSNLFEEGGFDRANKGANYKSRCS